MYIDSGTFANLQELRLTKEGFDPTNSNYPDITIANNELTVDGTTIRKSYININNIKIN